MGYSERDRELKQSLETQRLANEARQLKKELKQKELESKLDLQVADSFTEENFQTALHKMTEAAWRFDKQMPGAPNLDAFDSLEMEPRVFKEMLHRAFNIKVTPPELAALMNFFDTKGSGKISCQEFLIKFLGTGFEERARRRAQWRKMQSEANEMMIKKAEEKKEIADKKIELKVGVFSEADFHSANSKLTGAAIKYQKSGPGAVGLDAFEATMMPPHVFKEQLKLVFGIKITIEELAALMSIYDPGNEGGILCKDFLIQFFRIGFDERNRIRVGWRDEQSMKRAREEAVRQEKDRENEQRSQAEVDYDFLEQDFDTALHKYLMMCHGFEQRQLGPAGLAGFSSASLKPNEFREMVKRTFGLKVGPKELGALVRYFETTVKDVVNCVAFLNSFVQVRVSTEEFKVSFFVWG